MADAPAAAVEALAAFGLDLGIGFQLVDDALDYIAREERLGKPVGSDFREGKITYPVMHVMKHAGPEERARLKSLAVQEDLDDDDLAPLREMVDRYEAVPATMESGGRVPRPRPRPARPRARLAGSPHPPPFGRFRPRARLVTLACVQRSPYGVQRWASNLEP